MKVDEIKKQQNYRKTLNMCGNCKHYKSELGKKTSHFYTYTVEKKKRCMLGFFAVQKTATCDLWEKI